MFHVELRQFPHNFCRFNMSEGELRRTILDGWTRGEWIEMGERKWSPHQATLTVLDGPELPVEDLSMGRGWRNAQRKGRDVTEQLLASTRAATSLTANASGPPATAPPASSLETSGAAGAPSGVRPSPDALARELLALLGDDPVSLMRAWQLALERHPDRTPSECLARAEDLVRR